MNCKLSILPRQSDKTGWHQSDQFKVPEIQKIKVDGAGLCRSLNSIPSPFARMHLFETAFEMVFQDHINETKLAGETYNKLVSDCLDVFELIYNWDSHIKEGKQLEMTIWKKDDEIFNLKNAVNNSHKLLGETLDTFIKGENAFSDFDKCLIIKFDNKVIAGTSPFTGFFTTPDDLSTLGLLKPLSQVAYFSKPITFQARKPEIKRFIYDFFENNPILRGSNNTTSIRDFLEKNKGNIKNVAPTVMQPLFSRGAQVNIFGKNIEIAKSIGTQFFEPQILRLNYRLNSDCFMLPGGLNDNRGYDYLLPLSTSFFEEFDVKQIHQIVSITESEPGFIQVTISLNEKNITKNYRQNHLFDQDGTIVDLYVDHHIRVNLAIFPFLKVIDQPQDTDYNDFYRIMLAIQDDYYKYSNKNFNLQFGKDNRIFEDGTVYSIKRIDRTVPEKGKTPAGSIYYGLNTCFDFIHIEFPSINGEKVRGAIVPKWREKTLGNKQVDFSIDFGTTSTFIAYTDDPTHNTEPKPFELNEKDLPVGMLNKPKEKRSELKWIDCFESETNFIASIQIQRQEFIPSIIKRNEKYEFPIRSVVYQKKSIAANLKILLCNTNISFVYQKRDAIDMLFEEYVTNLKWNIKTSSDFESTINIFIEELIYLIRTKILLNDGDPRKSKIFWFSPLSFTRASERAYTDLWKKFSSDIFKTNANNIKNLTESEAPFYYLFKNASINNASSVLTLDIGGGSTDLMLFKDNKPLIGSSVHFGANIIWGNGFNDFISAKTNGIYLSLKDNITERLQTSSLKKLNEDLISSENFNAGSDEIINFWISNNKETKVLDKLKDGKFRFSYLLHLCALIYHSLKLLKRYNEPAPTCIIFSGNGSKYIDLIDDYKCVEKIWGYFIRKIYDSNNSNPQVILPEKNRKEATCYGGLYVNSAQRQFKPVNYLGIEIEGEEFEKYSDIEKEKSKVFDRVLSSFNEFIDWFFEMNVLPELNFRQDFGIELKLKTLKEFIIDKAPENLNEGYAKRSKLVNLDDLISDSLFYYPLVGLIAKINKLIETDFMGKTIYYASNPDSEKEFLISRITTEKKPDSIYAITVEDKDPNIGHITILNDPEVHQRAISVSQGYIDPVCSYKIFPEQGQSIKVIEPGLAKKEGDKWILTEKIKIEFI